MSTETKTITSAKDADARIHAVIVELLSCQLTEKSARLRIFEEFLQIDIAGQVAATHRNLSPQKRADLAEDLRWLLLNKTISRGPSGFDITKAAQSSPTGWARELLRSASPSRLRKLAQREAEVSVDPTEPVDGAPVSHADLTFHQAYVEDEPQSAVWTDEVSSLTEDYLETAKHQSEATKLRLAAEAFRAAYRLPEVIRPADWLDRMWVLWSVEADPMLAWTSAVAFRDLVSATMSHEQRSIDERLLSLWDDFSAEDIDRIAELDARVAHVLVAQALTPLDRPHRSVIAGAKSLMRMSSASTKPWISLCQRLLDGWLAVECQPTSRFDRTADLDKRHSLTEKQVEDAELWPDAVAEVTAWPGKPFGSTMQEVSEWIRSAVESYSANLGMNQLKESE